MRDGLLRKAQAPGGARLLLRLQDGGEEAAEGLKPNDHGAEAAEDLAEDISVL